LSRYERSILGAILVNGKLYEQAAGLRPDEFSLDFHRQVFHRIGELAGSGRPIDTLTVIEELERYGELRTAGDSEYVARLIDGTPDRPSVQYYVKMMREATDRRRAAKLGENLLRLAEDPTAPTTALAEIGHDLTGLTSTDDWLLPPRFSEEALALRFSRRYADDLRYVSRWGHWMRWDGMRWVDDDTLHVFDLSRGICRAASAECGESEKAAAIRLASKATSAAVERLATADRRHAATVVQWDTDPWLLNTPEGTVDLRTGEMHKHRRDEYITKITNAGPATARYGCSFWIALPVATQNCNHSCSA